MMHDVGLDWETLISDRNSANGTLGQAQAVGGLEHVSEYLAVDAGCPQGLKPNTF
jgi:hypothetical protein